jgi:hypothetical protein
MIRGILVVWLVLILVAYFFPLHQSAVVSAKAHKELPANH